MFILKEDVKTIFRKLEVLEEDCKDLRREVKKLRYQANCNHGTFRGKTNHGGMGTCYTLICTNCGKVMKTLTYEEYCHAEAEYFKQQADKYASKKGENKQGD